MAALGRYDFLGGGNETITIHTPHHSRGQCHL
jgi:hypothetical protein